MTCATTVTAVSAVVDSLTQVCNEMITPISAEGTDSDALEAAAKRLSAISNQLSGISARFRLRQEQFKRNKV